MRPGSVQLLAIPLGNASSITTGSTIVAIVAGESGPFKIPQPATSLPIAVVKVTV